MFNKYFMVVRKMFRKSLGGAKLLMLCIFVYFLRSDPWILLWSGGSQRPGPEIIKPEFILKLKLK